MRYMCICVYVCVMQMWVSACVHAGMDPELELRGGHKCLFHVESFLTLLFAIIVCYYRRHCDLGGHGLLDLPLHTCLFLCIFLFVHFAFLC